MQEAEEQDTCRICSAPAEPDQPLFHPCKCSGTIRYIHQDCLTTWLAHSKKKTCDVCKHPYSFTKVYAPNMPSHLPPFLLLRRLIQQFLLANLFAVRVTAVAIIWLAVLPWITVWTWRMYFSMGESTAWWISNRPRPNRNDTLSLFQKVRYESGYPNTKNILGRITTHPAWISLSADIFTGQIIAALIVLTFVAIFLLREWISQNARPGLFEEEDVVPDDQPNPMPMAPEPQPPRVAQRMQGFPEPEAFDRHQKDAIRALDALRIRDQEVVVQQEESHPEQSSEDRLNQEVHHPGWSPQEERDFLERMHKPEYKRRVKNVRIKAARRRAIVSQHEARRTSPSPFLPGDQQTYDFTFKAAPSSYGEGEFGEADDTPRWLTPSISELPAGESEASSSTFFPPVTLQPPKEDIPYSIRSWSPASSPPPIPENGPFSKRDEIEPPRRRPTLPASTLATANSDHSFAISPGRSPMGSPGLAMYHPPEELFEAGPSHAPAYFDSSRPSSAESSVQEAPDESMMERDAYDHLDPDSGVDTVGQGRRQGLELLSDSEDETDEDEMLFDPAEHDNDHLQQVPDFFDLDERDDEEDEEDEDEEDIFFLNEEEVERRRQEPGIAQVEGGEQQPNNGNPMDMNGVRAGNEEVDPNDDMDGNVEDDMEGALEAIGMRGPVFGVFQNAALMVFVLDTAIGLCIWIPFTVGKTSALLALDPQRLLQILHLPIKAMRLVTDPIVDSIAYVITRFLIPPCMQILRKGVHAAGAVVSSVTTTLFGDGATNNVSQFSTKLYQRSLDIFDPLSHFASWSVSRESAEAGTTPEPEHLFPEPARFLEPYFAQLGKEVRVFAGTFQEAWTRMAVNNGPAERVFAIFLGYSVFGLLLAIYLNLLTVGNARTAGRAIRNAIRQQLLVIKVAGFIFIELVVFPLGCGIVLDICTVWLFPEANLQSRVAFFSQAPLTAMFYHWIAGTLFMYSFAVLLSGCRSIMRPGAMWFVKDPQDQNSHPIRDILERPTLTQLRKICVSGVMYSVVVACVVGSIAGLLVLGNRSIMPFRWKNREPLSNVPVDLLFLHLVLPQTMHHFRPKRAVKNLTTRIWRILASRFRLTSYFFGGRYPGEEVTPHHWSLRPKTEGELEGVSDGTFQRVPATDYLALPRDLRATARVHEDGTPVNEEAIKLIDRQNWEAEKAKHDPSKDYMVVYVPPSFRLRLFSFILLLWSVCAVIFGLAVAFPIQLGRSVFQMFTPREVHDGYSLMIGFYLLWACYLAGKAVDRLDKRRQRVRMDDGPHADLRILVFKRSLLWAVKSLYMTFSLGVLVPILLALVVDLYLVLPVRTAVTPGIVPKIRIIDAWALGLIYGKIAIHVTQLHPPNQITRGLQHIIINGWVRLDPITATKEVIAPLVGGLLGMILVPGLWLQFLRYLLPTLALHKNFMFMNLYPAIFLVAGLIRSSVVVYDALSSWSQSIRDKEFLVELRLKNHETDVEKPVEALALQERDGSDVSGVEEEAEVVD